MVIIMSKKTVMKKLKLAKAERQNKRLPLFVTIRTKRKFVSNIKRRNWRTKKLRIE